MTNTPEADVIGRLDYRLIYRPNTIPRARNISDLPRGSDAIGAATIDIDVDYTDLSRR